MINQIIKEFDLCINTWNDLPPYVYTTEYKKAFIQFLKKKQDIGQELTPSIATMTLYHEIGNRKPYFKFNRNK